MVSTRVMPIIAKLSVHVLALVLTIVGAGLVYRNVGIGGRRSVMGKTRSGVLITLDQFQHARRRTYAGLWLVIVGCALVLVANYLRL